MKDLSYGDTCEIPLFNVTLYSDSIHAVQAKHPASSEQSN